MNHQIKLNYRPEIDGLRAIAVISVIIYHIEFFISGKKNIDWRFFGSWYFFVISGYLITLLIVKEFSRIKNFFKNFYFRRAKSIFPALLFMISVSIFFAWIYLTPDNFIQYSNSIISSIFFYSNYFFILKVSSIILMIVCWTFIAYMVFSSWRTILYTFSIIFCFVL